MFETHNKITVQESVGVLIVAKKRIGTLKELLYYYRVMSYCPWEWKRRRNNGACSNSLLNGEIN